MPAGLSRSRPPLPRFAVAWFPGFPEIERIVWDRLPKQTVRSQIRFYLSNGDLWTFSGNVDESALPTHA